MKKTLIYITCALALSSCDPDVPGEGINLPEIQLGFKVIPDTAYVKVGDTITIYVSVSSTLDNGVVVTDGKATTSFTINHTDEIPQETFGTNSAKNSEHIYIYSTIGEINLSSDGILRDVYAVPIDDSIKTELKIIPIKKGTYTLSVYSKFYEGSSGKTRTLPKFDMEDTHWDLFRVPGYTVPSPGREGYYTAYRLAVYE